MVTVHDEDSGPSEIFSMPNIRHLRIVESVGRNSSISRAAVEVSLSQPAVTQAIAKMEAAVGKPLFDRASNGSYLTAAGEVFLHRVRRFLDQSDRAIRDLHSVDADRGHASHITSTQIRCLIAIAQSTSFSQAARTVGISTASLHRAARELEANVRKPLYRTSKHGLVLTAQGSELARKLGLAIREIQAAEDDIRSLDGIESGKIVIGALPMSGAYLIGATIAKLTNSFPEARIYVTNSPSGGAMPFAPNAGVTHYYGVGAYCRPLDDARRANVRFAAESLAFSHVPQQATLDRHLAGVRPVQDPSWKARVPRDRGTSWDFEDVREHYLTALYGLDPQKLRREDPGRYLDYSRAVTAEVTEATFAEWRRPQSSCNGALVWTLQDLLPGAGWGVIDSTGTPKSVWYALKRAFRSIQVLLSDEGTNGLDVHLINESSDPLSLNLELFCLRDGQQTVVSGRLELILAARQSRTVAATDLFGAFFDTTYAFRFGPPAHDVTLARLRDRDSGAIIAEAFHFPLGRSKALHPAAIAASIIAEDGNWLLELNTDRLAQSVEIEAAGFAAADNGFHLSPGETRSIAMTPLPAALPGQRPTGEIRTLSDPAISRF